MLDARMTGEVRRRAALRRDLLPMPAIVIADRPAWRKCARPVDNRCEDSRMRGQATVLHLDLDAFFAAVEQRDKPSLRGKAVVVGGVGPRGVVATASYEARRHGVRSAMPMSEARSRCPQAAFLSPRFEAYRRSSEVLMTRLRQLSPLVEPLSLDEAYVDLEHLTDVAGGGIQDVGRLAGDLRADITRLTGGLTASVGVGSSKLVAKIASDLAKPDGCVTVAPGTEQELIRPMGVGVIPGVGPATAERLRRIGVHTVAELEAVPPRELVQLLGAAVGQTLARLARADDDRPVVPERETKSVSVEDTFETDLVDAALLTAVVDRMSARVAERLSRERLSGRTVTLKVRRHDFGTHTRSVTLAGPTDDSRVIARLARGLLRDVDASDGIRLLGVGVSGLADWIQDDLFQEVEELPVLVDDRSERRDEQRRHGRWWPGSDLWHTEHGAGWVWGAGSGRVTVRFETATTPAGPVRTFAADDPALSAAPPAGPIASQS